MARHSLSPVAHKKTTDTHQITLMQLLGLGFAHKDTNTCGYTLTSQFHTVCCIIFIDSLQWKKPSPPHCCNQLISWLSWHTIPTEQLDVRPVRVVCWRTNRPFEMNENVTYDVSVAIGYILMSVWGTTCLWINICHFTLVHCYIFMVLGCVKAYSKRTRRVTFHLSSYKQTE